MKKLMIATAIICGTVISQAATIQWTSGTLYSASSESGGWSTTALKTAKIDATMQVFLISDADTWSSVSSLSADNMYTWTKGKTATYSGVNYSGEGTSKSYSSGITALDNSGIASGTYNTIILATYTDSSYGDMYMVKAITGTANAQGSMDILSIFGGKAPAYSGGWASASTSPVPEPTSGLLMLLGFASLALRRKRA